MFRLRAHAKQCSFDEHRSAIQRRTEAVLLYRDTDRIDSRSSLLAAPQGLRTTDRLRQRRLILFDAVLPSSR